MTVNPKHCNIDATVTRKRFRRERWNVTVLHRPSGIVGHSFGARSLKDGQDLAIARIESLLRAREGRP